MAIFDKCIQEAKQLGNELFQQTLTEAYYMTAPNGRKAIKAKEKIENEMDMRVTKETNVGEIQEDFLPEDRSESMPVRIKKENTSQYLKYDFTEEELKEMSEEIARSILERDEATSQLKGLKSQFDSTIKVAEAKISNLAEKLRSKYEYRTIPCQEIINYITGKYTLIRKDTGEVIKERELTIKESQIEMC